MPQIIRPIHFEPEVVKRMNHLMGHGIFEVSLVLHLIRADQDPILRIKATTLPISASTTVNIMTVKIAS